MNRKAELIIGLVALLVVIAALALCMYATEIIQKEKNTPVKESTGTWSYDYAENDSTISRLILEEGPGYKRMQYFSRVTMGLTKESESIYVEVR